MSNGIKIPVSPAKHTLNQSCIIAGYAGTGKSTLAAQLLVNSLILNNAAVANGDISEETWPEKARGIYYAIDQSAEEIRRMMASYKWISRSDIQVIPLRDWGNPIRNIHRELPASEKEAWESKLVYIREVPYEQNWIKIGEAVKEDTQRHGSSIWCFKVVVVDSLNSIVRVGLGSEALIGFKQIVDSSRGFDDDHNNTMIVTLELDDEKHLAEEYIADAVIVLNRERDVITKRTIEIRKARQQQHFIGAHEFRIKDEEGIKVFPSIAARSRLIPQTNTEKKPTSEPLRFGVKAIDDVLSKKSSTQPNEGSTTLLWGEPGTGKTDLCINFLFEQWREAPDSTVLFLTTKVDPRIVKLGLVEEFERDEGLMSALGLSSHLDVERAVTERIAIVEAGDPFRSHSIVFTEVVDEYYKADAIHKPMRRAVVFGIGLLEEMPEARDHQWRFMSALVLFLRSKDVSTMLVDWPLEGQNESINDRAYRPSRPRASKLCANELRTVNNDNGKILEISRSNYTAVGDSLRWDIEQKTWLPFNGR